MEISHNFQQQRLDPAHSAPGGSALESLDVSSIEPEHVLSTEELQVLKHKFALCNAPTSDTTHQHKLRALSVTHASKLFREDYPSLSEWEIQALFRKYDIDGDGHLSLMEYLQTRAYYRLLLEESTETELQRIFSILDTDADGLLLAHDVLHRIEQTGLHSVGILKQVLTQAAAATKIAEDSTSQHYHREGEITFEHFAATIRDVNRKMEQIIATKTLRVIGLQRQLQQLLQNRKPSPIDDRQADAIRIENEVLVHEIHRMKKELITDTNNALGEACEILVATYENEQHVYECLSNFITYCDLRDGPLFRYNLERAGKEVHILNSMLLSPPEHLKKTAEYAIMMDLSLAHESHKTPQLHHDNPTIHSKLMAAKSTHASTPSHATRAMVDTLLMNSTLRKQFAYYSMAGNVTNLVSITHSNFVKFVKDCDLHLLNASALTDVDINNIFAAASGTAKAMDFPQWLSACVLIFQRSQPQRGPFTDNEVEKLMETHVIARAKIIQVQHLAPDLSQAHVVKLLKEHIWQLKQIFSHFGIQSLVEVDNKVRLDMKEFLTFARAFNIIRAPTDRDGEPYSAPPMPARASIAPISLMELIREYYAAKLDISIANPARREAPDLTFREFLRCIQRIALAMHVRNPKKAEVARANGVLTTLFEATKADIGRSPEQVHSPRSPRQHQRRGNLLGVASSTKTCKMASTSVISRLLQTSRAMVTCQSPNAAEAPRLGLGVSPGTGSFIDDRIERPGTAAGRPQEVAQDTAQFNPIRPPWSRKARRRPVTSGGPPLIRVIQSPTI